MPSPDVVPRRLAQEIAVSDQDERSLVRVAVPASGVPALQHHLDVVWGVKARSHEHVTVVEGIIGRVPSRPSQREIVILRGRFGFTGLEQQQVRDLVAIVIDPDAFPAGPAHAVKPALCGPAGQLRAGRLGLGDQHPHDPILHPPKRTHLKVGSYVAEIADGPPVRRGHVGDRPQELFHSPVGHREDGLPAFVLDRLGGEHQLVQPEADVTQVFLLHPLSIQRRPDVYRRAFLVASHPGIGVAVFASQRAGRKPDRRLVEA